MTPGVVKPSARGQGSEPAPCTISQGYEPRRMDAGDAAWRAPGLLLHTLPLRRARQEPELASSQHPLPALPPGPGLSCWGRSRVPATGATLLCSDPTGFSTRCHPRCHGTDMEKRPSQQAGALKPNLPGANGDQHPKPAASLLLAPPSHSDTASFPKI